MHNRIGYLKKMKRTYPLLKSLSWVCTRVAEWIRLGAIWIAGPGGSQRPGRPDRIVGACCTLIGLSILLALIWPIITADAIQPISMEETVGLSHGKTLAQRRQVFRSMVAPWRQDEKTARRMFAGQPWSIGDHRANLERRHARQVARKYRIPLQVVYLILDEGIRNHWPGPDGHPLPAITPPLCPRQK